MSVKNELDGSYLSKRGYVLIKDNLKKETLETLKKELVGRPLQESTKGYSCIDTTFKLYIETKNKIYIPKIYGIDKFGNPSNQLVNYNGKDWENDIQFKGTIRDTQIEPIDKMMNGLENCNSGGILAMQTGGGKTISCINILSKLKKKTIVVVNKISLLKQWENEINTFLPNAKVGIIQGKKTDESVGDNDIVLAMLQSLARIDYPSAMFNMFGCTVVDECHNLSSPIFSNVLMKLCSKYTIGLSATPNRSDGCEYVFKWFLGDVLYKSKTQRVGLPPIIELIKIKSDEYKESVIVNKFTGKSQIQFATMLTDLIQMSKRNKLIVEIIINLVKTENRKILVLSDRREHVKLIKDILDNDTRVCFTYGLFIGQMKISELEKSKACQVILATYQAFGEGVSEKELDTLLLITPKKFIGHLQNVKIKNESGKLEQIVGRIFRKDHLEKSPMIVDLQDNFSIYKNQSNQRLVFYNSIFPKRILTYKQIDFSKFDSDSIKYSDCISKQESVVSLDCLL